jgi:hypothetical protein
MPNGRVLLFYFAVAFAAALFFVYVVPLIRRYMKDAKNAYKMEEDALGVGDAPKQETKTSKKAKR